MPVGNTTPLRFLLARLATAGITEIWVNLHFHPQQVRDEALRWAAPTMNLHFLNEPHLLGTGGTLLEMVQQSGSLPDVIVNAKMFTDFDFQVLTSQTSSPVGSVMVLHPLTALADYGGLTYDANGLISGLHPRNAPSPANPTGAAVFTGIARPDSAWLDFLRQARLATPKLPICSIRHGLVPAIAAGISSARALLHHGYWKEISTPQRVAEIRAEMPDVLS